ncbi:MAG TPA: hypothetical protein VMF33_05420 [Acidimicrobiales bacterium]|nr:hypothetical protein [Acidimicrobiales bacterium]
MAIHTDAPREIAPDSLDPTQSLELLFKEARARQRRRRLRWMTFALAAVVAIGVVMGVTYRAGGSSPRGSSAGAPLAAKTSAKILTCEGAKVVRPVNYIVACADGGIRLTQTRWSTWSTNEASGTTDFAINFCKPYCAASPISYFPNSPVHLSAPLATKNGTLFSLLTVRYEYRGASRLFRFSFKGEPSYAK